MLFKKQNIDVAVIEVGLGGTLDASNILQTDVSVLVSVGLDHTEILGNTIEEIANDKIGIIKDNGTVICGFTQESVRRMALKRSVEKRANILFINNDFEYIYCDEKSSIKTRDFCSHNVNLSIKGEHQAHNASCAVAAYGEFVNKHKKPFSKDAVINGLSQAELSGRSEIIQNEPTVILDGAHNPDKLNAFFSMLSELTSTPTIIVAIKKGRDVNSEIFPIFEKLNAKNIIATSFYDKGIWESLPSEELKQEIQKHCSSSVRVSCISDPMEAIKTSLAESDNSDVIAVTGSLFLVGDIREYWQSKEELLQQFENRCKG